MRGSTKPLLMVLVIVVAVLGVLGGLRMVAGPPREHAGQVKVGQKLDILLHRFTGATAGPQLKLRDVGAKIVVLNFWASWCEACLVEMPSLVRLREKFHAAGLEVVPINVDDVPAAVVPRMAEALGIQFPIYVDEGQRLSQLFDVHGIPFTVILRGEGEVLAMEAGERDWFSKEIQERIQTWLGSPSL